jgi:hypothetical protein
MMHLAENELTLMRAVVPLTHRTFCYLEPPSKYPTTSIYRLQMIYQRCSVNHSLSSPFAVSVDIPTTGPFVVRQEQCKWPISRYPCLYYYSHCVFDFAFLGVGCFRRHANSSRISPWWTIGSVVKFAHMCIEVRKYDAFGR